MEAFWKRLAASDAVAVSRGVPRRGGFRQPYGVKVLAAECLIAARISDLPGKRAPV
jgi:hypothetical protein